MPFLKRYYKVTTLFLFGLFIAYLAHIQDNGFTLSPRTIYCETSEFITKAGILNFEEKKIEEPNEEKDESKPCPNTTT